MIDTQQCLSRHPIESIDLDKWQQTADLIARLYDAACGAIVQFRQDEFNAVVASRNEDNFLQRDSAWPWEMRSFCRRIMETGKELYVGDPANHEEWKGIEPVCAGTVRSYFGFPIQWPDGTLFGTICVIDSKSTDYNPVQLELLEQLRDLINADLKMAFAYDEIRRLALTDELTGIANRRGLQLLGAQRIKDARRFRTSIGVIFFDIDRMKYLNDTHGHSAGDRCISLVAQSLDEVCRDSDVTARVGGDEFIVMVLADSEADVEALSQRIVEHYDASRTGDALLVENSLSVGHQFSSELSPEMFESMIDQADKQMYLCKQARR